MKNPLTPAGIEPANFQFVAQHLNHCATAVPSLFLDFVHFLIFDVCRKWIGQEIFCCIVSKTGLVSKGGYIMLLCTKIITMDELLFYIYKLLTHFLIINTHNPARFEVFTTVLLNINVFCDVKLHRLVMFKPV